MKSGVAKRVLFLVDRRALAAQAVRAFAAFEAEPGKKFDKIYEVYSQRFQRAAAKRPMTVEARWRLGNAAMPRNGIAGAPGWMAR